MAAKLTKGRFNKLLKEHRDRLAGGLADTASPDQFDRDQLYRGMQVEMEHTSDPRIALEIAMDHLAEHPRYYDYLDAMERKMPKAKPTKRRPARNKFMPVTKAQENALREYAKWSGPRWKEDLATDWMRAGSYWPGDYAILQHLRNTHGPAWLNQFSFEAGSKLNLVSTKRTAWSRKPNPVPTGRFGRTRDETDTIIDRIIVDEDLKRAIPRGEWGSVKTVLTVLVGNELDHLTGVFVEAVKKGDLSNFYVDDRVKVKMVESGYSMGKVGKGALKKAIKDLQKQVVVREKVVESIAKKVKRADDLHERAMKAKTSAEEYRLDEQATKLIEDAQEDAQANGIDWDIFMQRNPVRRYAKSNPCGCAVASRTPTITAAQIRSLRGEAAAAGDQELVRVCDRAAKGNRAAKTQCARVILAAKAMDNPHKGFTCPAKPPVKKGKLSAATRRGIPKNLFLLPEYKDLPVHNYGHTRAAIGRLQMMWNQGHLTPEQYREAWGNLEDACKCFGIELRTPPAIPMKGTASAMAKKTTKKRKSTKKSTARAAKKATKRKVKTAAKACDAAKEEAKEVCKIAKATKRKAAKKTSTKAKKTTKRKVKKVATKAKKTTKRKVKKAATKAKKTTKRTKVAVATLKRTAGVKITNTSLVKKLASVEGANWAKRHDGTSPHSPEMNLEAFRILTSKKMLGDAVLADLKPGLGIIRGTGQTKYLVNDNTGEVSLVGATANEAKRAKALKAGFNVV